MKLDIDFPKLVRRLIPNRMRSRAVNIDFFSAYIHPIRLVHEALMAFVPTAERLSRYNGITFVMERALNDMFDPLLRRMIVRNVNTFIPISFVPLSDDGDDPVYMPLLGEEPLLFLGTRLEYTDPDGFEVESPSDLATNDLAINNRVGQLAVAGVKWKTVYV